LNDTEIWKFFDNNYLEIFYTDTYTDQDDTDTVKIYLENRIFFSMMPNITKKVDFFLQSSEIHESQGYFADKKHNKTFKMGHVRNFDEHSHGKPTAKLFSAYLRRDFNSLVISKNLYSITNLVSSTAGYWNILYMTLYLITLMLNRLKYQSHLLK